MDKNTKIEDQEEVQFGTILKKGWPCYVSYGIRAFTASALFINLLIISQIIWPGDPFHSYEVGILIGLGTYMMAFSGFLFGNLADRYSRIVLFSVATGAYGFGLLLNGFAPEGLGLTTYVFFIVCQLIRGFFSGALWPTINSYANDATRDIERSRFFGGLTAVWQIFQTIGMLIVAFSFEFGLWRFYFIITGIVTILIAFLVLKGKEYKRAATHEELKDALADEDVEYDYVLNKDTIKSTIIAPTNLIAFAEGIFTTIVLSIPDFLLIAYLQSPPLNYSQVSISILMIISGIPAALFGAVVLGKLSDRLANLNVKYRIYMIIFAIILTYLMFITVFFLPLPHLSIEDGNGVFKIFTFPIFWIVGLIAFAARSVLGLYSINQSPILQKINLPEAQGVISSANQFLELIGSGTGPIVAGGLLMLFGGNYQITVLITMTIGIIGALLWFFAVFFLEKDINRVSSILEERGAELLAKKKVVNV
ncbi:MAG: putative 3-hydroxyphenylpropionic transporter MhpT [Promethearchaeota archaeon]|nr:MAG: putative 3-hydroxyphenylpropionic transporter MhpT [Candidatus Lokiarchaeota archaeon]